MIDLGSVFGEDGLTTEEQQQWYTANMRANHRVLMALRVARAVEKMPQDKKDGIWAKFRFVWALRREQQQ